MARAIGLSAVPIVAHAQGSPQSANPLGSIDTTGSSDMTSVIQQAVHAVGDGGGLLFPNGRILVRDTITIPYDRQRWIGAGRGATRLIFAPRSDATLLRFGKTTNITPQQTLRGMTITSADTSFSKTAIELIDTSHFQLDDIEITGLKPALGTLAWSGGTAGSVGIRTFGRELPRFGGGCYVSADNPLRISKNARSSNPQIDADFFSLRDVFFIANGQPVVLIDGDVELINFLVDGCSFNRGTNAIKWVGSRVTRASSSFAVRSTRWEQAQNPAAYAFDIQPQQNLYGLIFDGVTVPPDANGFRLRNCVGPVFRQVVCRMNTARVALDVDSTVRNMRHEGCYWGANTSVQMPGQRLIWGSSLAAAGEPLPRDALYDAANVQATDLHFDVALGGRIVTLEDGEAVVLGGYNTRGWVFVIDSEGQGSQFFVRSIAQGVQFVPGSDVGSAFSTAAGTTRRTNLYWSESVRRLELQNLSGLRRAYRVIVIGALSGP
jgi:hypothetical protein